VLGVVRKLKIPRFPRIEKQEEGTRGVVRTCRPTAGAGHHTTAMPASFVSLSGDSSSSPNGKCYFSKPRPTSSIRAWGNEIDSDPDSASAPASPLPLHFTLNPRNYRSRLALYGDGSILLQYLGSYSTLSCTTTVELSSGGLWRVVGDDDDEGGQRIVVEPTGLLGDVCVLQHGGEGEVEDFSFCQKREEGKEGEFDIVLTSMEFEAIYTFGAWSESTEEDSEGD
jgi:hypothetical protein